MKIPANSIILAPSTFHLALYQQILKQNKNTKNIQVISLSSFVHSFFNIEIDDSSETLFKYKNTLKELSKSNSYYVSINDLNFLQSCLSFIQWAKLYNLTLESLPTGTKKEQDIKEILTLLYPITLFEDYSSYVLNKINNINHVYILKKNFSKTDKFWVNQLLKKGAHYLEYSFDTDIYYYTCASNRKEVELISKIIIDEQLDANDIFVAVNNDQEKYILSQSFEMHQIPYTLLKQPVNTTIVDEWSCVLNWIQNKNIDTFINLLKYTFKNDYSYMLDYYTAFPDLFMNDDYHLQTLTYQENQLIDETQFNYLKNIELKVQTWNQEHKNVYNWTLNEIEEIAAFIQSLHTNVKKEDINTFKSINTHCIQALPYIKDSSDFSVLISSIESLKTTKPDSIKGVLIGNKNELSSIRPIHFVLGAHAKNYPAIQIESGLFDEVYLSKIPMPSLQERLESQKTQLQEMFFMAEKCYVIYAQSDYEGNSFEVSEELNTIFNKKPKFVDVPDPSLNKTQDFLLSEEIVKELFFKNNVLSVSRLETFAKCPFSHFLKYGLHLQEPKEWTDLSTKGSILHSILEQVSLIHRKEYTKISNKELKRYVENEFNFAALVYPNKRKWIQTQIEEFTQKLTQVFEQLDIFETEWHMDIKEAERKFVRSIEWNNTTIDLIGYVDRIDTSKTSFCIFDYKSGKRELKVDKYQSGLSLQLITYTLGYQDETELLPVGCFYITLRSPYINTEALQVSYSRKGEKLGECTENNLQSDEEFIKQKFINGWGFNGLDTYLDTKDHISIPRASVDINEAREQWPIIINGLLKEMSSGDIYPTHTEDACTYCQYGRICRDIRQEYKRQSYIKED